MELFSSRKCPSPKEVKSNSPLKCPRKSLWARVCRFAAEGEYYGSFGLSPVRLLIRQRRSALPFVWKATNTSRCRRSARRPSLGSPLSIRSTTTSLQRSILPSEHPDSAKRAFLIEIFRSPRPNRLFNPPALAYNVRQRGKRPLGLLPRCALPPGCRFAELSAFRAEIASLHGFGRLPRSLGEEYLLFLTCRHR